MGEQLTGRVSDAGEYTCDKCGEPRNKSFTRFAALADEDGELIVCEECCRMRVFNDAKTAGRVILVYDHATQTVSDWSGYFRRPVQGKTTLENGAIVGGINIETVRYIVNVAPGSTEAICERAP